MHSKITEFLSLHPRPILQEMTQQPFHTASGKSSPSIGPFQWAYFSARKIAMAWKLFFKLLFVFLGIFHGVQVYAQIDHWENLVHESDNWRYFIGNSEPPAQWNSPSFNDANWPSGPGGIGYGDGDDQTTIANCASLYMRRSFSAYALSDMEALVFHADYDDGFVAYLNGVEIARANVDALDPPFDHSPAQWREAKMKQGGDPVTYVVDEGIWKNLLQYGLNVLAVHTLNTNGSGSSDMSARYWLHCGMKTAAQTHQSPAVWFNYQSFESPVAIMRINTWEEDIVDSPSIRGEMEIVWNDSSGQHASYGPAQELKTNISIEKRGRFSQFVYPKNGYAIETKDSNWEDTDVSPLGLAEEEDWVLHGPYGDRSFMRNVLAMHMANEQGNYASRTRYVELFVNGDYEGLYVLMEKIKRGPDRVNIAKLNPDEISGDDLTGGYIFKTDWEPVDWRSSFSMLWDTTLIPYTYTYPKRKNIAAEQEQYIQAYVDDWEHSMQNTSAPYKGKYWYEYLDMASFVDYFLMMEVSKNIDAYRASAYYHKKKDSNGGKIYAGPVWDFNFAFGLVDYCEGYLPYGYMADGNWCSATNPAWWAKLKATPQFADAVNCRWKELTSSVWHRDSLIDFIHANENLLSPIAGRNHARWPLIGGYNPASVKYVASTYGGDVQLVEDWLMNRMDWLDSNMIGAPCNLSTTDRNIGSALNIHPNPSTGVFTIKSSDPILYAAVYSSNGTQVWAEHFSSGKNKVALDLSALPNGLYSCILSSKQGQQTRKILLVH